MTATPTRRPRAKPRSRWEAKDYVLIISALGLFGVQIITAFRVERVEKNTNHTLSELRDDLKALQIRKDAETRDKTDAEESLAGMTAKSEQQAGQIERQANAALVKEGGLEEASLAAKALIEDAASDAKEVIDKAATDAKTLKDGE